MLINRPKSEEKIIKFWKKNQIFEKSLEKKGGDFVFYEGPPTANAKPGVHHVLARVYKDIICRYKTMKGFRVLRKAGWDIHGLPVELEVEKSLGLKDKKDIEKYGVDKFNQECKKSVWQYAKDWADLTERIGFWLDLENPYITGDPFYMESVFNIIKQISDKGLLYQDYKVVPYCPRCGTGLSSHEVAQGYKKIKEPAIYVKFKIQNSKFKIDSKFKIKNSKFYLLVWTTTPWTLPGNVAIAVNPKITYILAKVGKDCLIVAKERKEVLGDDFEIVKEFKGKELVGLSYESLFDKKVVALPREAENIYKVLPADFVTTEEGTGLVHMAPAFGQDDMELIKIQNSKLKIDSKFKIRNSKFPILLTVDEEGRFKSEVKKWAGMFVKDADPLIIRHLEEEGCLFKEEQYEHDYPFCWRCETPLLYYAKKSWFIKMSKVKERIIENNQRINWVPAHIKEGRFGEWLNELKDWALSRERYWGTPLPIWKCEDCEHQEVIGGRDDLKKQKFSTNKYFVLRHGEAVSNTEEFYSSYPEIKKAPLTEKGKRQTEQVAKNLKKEKIDLIFASDLQRTKQTAEIIAEATGAELVFDERLREVGAGDFNGQAVQKGREFYNSKRELSVAELVAERFIKPLPGGETFTQVLLRTLNFIREVEKKHQNKNILFVSHQSPLVMFEVMSKGLTIEEGAELYSQMRSEMAELRELKLNFFPYDRRGGLDFHRPHIDEIQFLCPKCGETMKRVPEVIDCWFDSGSMPFAQGHWPFAPSVPGAAGEGQQGGRVGKPPELFPADYISEAVDQTRGWFYTLLAISTLLGFESSYKNVIVLGLVLDEKGQKMSKSKGNVVDPWEMVKKYGADALRWYFFTINQPWDTKLFSEKDLDQRLKKFVMTFWNCYAFWNTYKGKSKILPPSPAAARRRGGAASKNILDKWILSRLNGLIEDATKKLDEYDITGTARAIEAFVIDDLSLWYIRRSRKRFQKPDSAKELEQASSVLGYVLLSLARLTAPFAPFISEEIYFGLTDKELKPSVHLDDWPKSDKKLVDKELEEKMQLVRDIVALGLKIRSDEKIKVRQPLKKLEVQIFTSRARRSAPRTDKPTPPAAAAKPKIEEKFLDLAKEELNVKEVEIVEKIKKEDGWVVEGDEKLKVALNIEITAGLREEGMVREVTRQIQEMRKNAGCKPRDKIIVYYSGDKDLTTLLARNKELVLSQVMAEDLISQRKEKRAFNIEKQFKIDGQGLWLGLKIVVR